MDWREEHEVIQKCLRDTELMGWLVALFEKRIRAAKHRSMIETAKGHPNLDRLVLTTRQLLGARFRGEQTPIDEKRLAQWLAEGLIRNAVARAMAWAAWRPRIASGRRKAYDAWRKAHKRSSKQAAYYQSFAAYPEDPLFRMPTRSPIAGVVRAVAWSISQDLPPLDDKGLPWRVRRGNTQKPLRIVCRIVEHITGIPVQPSRAREALKKFKGW